MTKDGVPLKVETIPDKDRIIDILTNVFKPEFLLEMHRRTKKYGEVFFQFNGGVKSRYPEVIHFLVHLVSGDEDVEHGTFIIAFHVDAYHIQVAIDAANALKEKFKEMNQWGEGHMEWAGNMDTVSILPMEEPPETNPLQQ